MNKERFRKILILLSAISFMYLYMWRENARFIVKTTYKCPDLILKGDGGHWLHMNIRPVLTILFVIIVIGTLYFLMQSKIKSNCKINTIFLCISRISMFLLFLYIVQLMLVTYGIIDKVLFVDLFGNYTTYFISHGYFIYLIWCVISIYHIFDFLGDEDK